MPQSLRLLDRTAISLSGLCLVHCLALPVLALAIPTLSVAVEAEWVHQVFVLLAAPISMLALTRAGTWRSPHVAGLAVLGLGLLAAGAFAAVGATQETVLTVAGGVALALCHLLNLRRGHLHARLDVAHDH